MFNCRVIGKYIKTAREKAKLTQEQLALAIGAAGQSTLGNYERDKNLPDVDVLRKIAEVTGTSISYLVGELDLRPRTASDTAANYTPGIPIGGYVQGGAEDGYFTNMDYEPGDGDGIIAFPGVSSTAYAKRVRGDSMAPKMPNGSFVIADSNPSTTPGDDVIVHTRDGKTMIKQLLFERNGDVILGSINSDYGQITVPKLSIAEIHLVLAYLPRGTKLHREN